LSESDPSLTVPAQGWSIQDQPFFVPGGARRAKKLCAELESLEKAGLAARKSLASQPLDFIRLPRKLTIFGV
jgi:hypothetical protein